MGKVLEFRPQVQAVNTPVSEGSALPEVSSGFIYEVVQDVKALQGSTGLSPEEALRMARDFYRKYPALLEWVGTPEVVVYKGDDLTSLLTNFKL